MQERNSATVATAVQPSLLGRKHPLAALTCRVDARHHWQGTSKGKTEMKAIAEMIGLLAERLRASEAEMCCRSYLTMQWPLRTSRGHRWCYCHCIGHVARARSSTKTSSNNKKTRKAVTMSGVMTREMETTRHRGLACLLCLRTVKKSTHSCACQSKRNKPQTNHRYRLFFRLPP